MDIPAKVAIVTGAAAETGRFLAQRLAREGAAVVVADIDTAGGAETVEAIEAAGGRAAFARADVRVDADVEAMVQFAAERFGGIGILVNNAGGGGNIEPHYPEASAARWSAWIDLNLRGPMLATQHALPVMRAAGQGAVVNIASTAGLGFGPHPSPEYAAAKAGLIRFTAALTDLPELTGVRVNCVAPDWIATGRARRELSAMSAEERAEAPTQVELDDIADAVVRVVVDDTLRGRVIAIWGGRPPLLIDPD